MGMNIYLTNTSALSILRACHQGEGPSLHEAAIAPAPSACNMQMVRALDALGHSRVLGNIACRRWDVLVSDASDRSRGTNVSCAVESADLPEGSFLEVEVAKDSLVGLGIPPDVRVFVDSPELCLLHSAALLRGRVGDGSLDDQLAFARLFGLASELAGTYGRSPVRPMLTEPSYGLEPLSSSERMQAYLELCDGAHGIGLARSVASCSADRLASPFETLVYALLALPPRRGGIGFPQLDINKSLDLTRLDASFEHERLTPDLMSEELGLVVECDGAGFHSGCSSFVEDRRRIRDYQKLGFHVIPLSPRDVGDVRSAEAFLSSMVDASSSRMASWRTHRLRQRIADERVRERRAKLLAALLPAIYE